MREWSLVEIENLPQRQRIGPVEIFVCFCLNE